MTEHPILRTANLSKSFGSVSVLSSIDFHVDPNESLGLIGDNGAGKSTLNHTLSGIVRASRGQVLFEGQDITRRHSRDIVRAGLTKKLQASLQPRMD